MRLFRNQNKASQACLYEGRIPQADIHSSADHPGLHFVAGNAGVVRRAAYDGGDYLMTIQTMTIGERQIGPGHPTYIIAELVG